MQGTATDKDLSAVIAACLSFYRSNKPVTPADYRKTTLYSELSEILRDALFGLSTFQQAAYRGAGWKVDANHPGYLIRVDPPLVVRAPFHIVPVFPSSEALEGIWRLSRRIKTSDDSIICLSGSTALLKASLLSGDLDFCEYVRSRSGTTAQQVAWKTTETSEVLFTRMKFDTHRWVRGQSPVAEVAVALGAIDPRDPNRSNAKVDYVGKAEGFRPSEVSNVIIFCDDNWESASMSRSFAAQEAAMDASIALPNDMCEPFQIGRYVDWLLSEALSYVEARNNVKAIKRCLSLSRVAFLVSITKEIRNHIDRSSAFIADEIANIVNVVEHLSASNERNEKWLAELEGLRAARDQEIMGRNVAEDIAKLEWFTKGTIVKISESLEVARPFGGD